MVAEGQKEAKIGSYGRENILRRAQDTRNSRGVGRELIREVSEKKEGVFRKEGMVSSVNCHRI